MTNDSLDAEYWLTRVLRENEPRAKALPRAIREAEFSYMRGKSTVSRASS